MTQETKDILIKRAKSLGWRVGMFVAVSVVAFLADNIGLLNLNPYLVTIVSLGLSEVTKYLNSQQQVM